MKTRKVRGNQSLFVRVFGRITRDEKGAITMEYGLLALLIAAALVASVMIFSTQVRNIILGAVGIAGTHNVSDAQKKADTTVKEMDKTAGDESEKAKTMHKTLSNTDAE